MYNIQETWEARPRAGATCLMHAILSRRKGDSDRRLFSSATNGITLLHDDL